VWKDVFILLTRSAVWKLEKIHNCCVT